jgi:phosphocarrier protein
VTDAPGTVVERRVTVAIAEGLHARPAALFVKLAAGQPVPVTVRRAAAEPGAAVPASSMLSVLAQGIVAGDEVVLRADGADEAADAALDALVEYLQRTTP